MSALMSHRAGTLGSATVISGEPLTVIVHSPVVGTWKVTCVVESAGRDAGCTAPGTTPAGVVSLKLNRPPVIANVALDDDRAGRRRRLDQRTCRGKDRKHDAEGDGPQHGAILAREFSG